MGLRIVPSANPIRLYMALTPSGQTTPAYTFGLALAQLGSVATGSQIPITLPLGHGDSCFDSSDAINVKIITAQQVEITIVGQVGGWKLNSKLF
jgi:hypothetical protein